MWSPTYNTRTVVNPIFDFISSCTNILKRDFLWIVWIAKWVFNDFVPCSITGRGTYAGDGCGGGFILDLFTPWCCPSSLRSPFLNSKKHVSIKYCISGSEKICFILVKGNSNLSHRSIFDIWYLSITRYLDSIVHVIFTSEVFILPCLHMQLYSHAYTSKTN